MLQIIATAKEWGKPPSLWLGRDGSWTDQDTKLTLAHGIYQAEHICSGCDLPIRICESREFEVKTRVCSAKRAIEAWLKDHEKSTPELGLMLGVKAVGRDGDDGERFVTFDDEK